MQAEDTRYYFLKVVLTALNIMLVVALNVGPLFFSFVSNRNAKCISAWTIWNECMLVQLT